MTREEQFKDEHADWLSAYKWDWFATLKLDFGFPSRRKALMAFDTWLDGLERGEGGRRFRWIRVISHDGNWNDICLYVLVGGLHSRRLYYQRQWARNHGRALIEHFDPSLCGIRCLVKAMDRDHNLEIDYGLK